MKQFLVGMLVLTGLCACAPQKGDKGDLGVPGTSPVSPTPTPVSSEQQKINDVVADENVYRLGLGQTLLSPGLSCTLYTVTGGDRIQSSVSGHNTLTGITSVATFLLKDSFNQSTAPVTDGLNVLPIALRPVYQNLYLLRCTGQLAVVESNQYSFELSSDDGSVLYIDGSKLVDNDNDHGPTLVTGSKYLRKGIHQFRLDFAETGAGSEQLVLTSGGSLISPLYWFH